MLAPRSGGASLVAAGAFVADQEGNDGADFDAARTALVGTRAADTIRDLQGEFRDHPEVRERILHPTTDEDRAFHDQFYAALRQTMTEAEVQRYAEPLIRDGHLAIETQMELNRGIADDSERASYDDLVHLARDGAARDPSDPAQVEQARQAEAERVRILTDEAYQEQVLGYLSADERQLAVSILEHADYIRTHEGHMHPVAAL